MVPELKNTKRRNSNGFNVFNTDRKFLLDSFCLETK